LKEAALGTHSFANYRTRIVFFDGNLNFGPDMPLSASH
jgi:hypothetical protein